MWGKLLPWDWSDLSAEAYDSDKATPRLPPKPEEPPFCPQCGRPRMYAWEDERGREHWRCWCCDNKVPR